MKRFLVWGMLLILIMSCIRPAGCGAAFMLAMSRVPGASGFPTGIYDLDLCATVNYPYYLAQTEVTYELWTTVAAWAAARGYHFAHPGNPGGGWDYTISSPIVFNTGHATDPVTMISWRDALVWNNALTEYYNEQNGTSLGCVYKDNAGKIIRDSRDANATVCDGAIIDPTAKGFRLPTGMEWELAARYIDGQKWTPGKYASGAAAFYGDAAETGAVAWFVGNSNVTGKYLFTAQPVGKKTPNALGLFDMSGNVGEWCFDRGDADCRVVRGGCSNNTEYDIIVSKIFGISPAAADVSLGLRPARTE